MMLTKEQIEAWLRGEPGILEAKSQLEKNATDLARTALSALARLADAQAAQALVVERAADECDVLVEYQTVVLDEFVTNSRYRSPQKMKAAIRALADPSGVEALAALRADISSYQEQMKIWHDKLEASDAERDRLAAANTALEAQVAGLVEAAQPFADVADLFDSEVEGVGAHDTLSLWLNGDDEEPAWRAADFKLGDFGTLRAALATRQASIGTSYSWKDICRESNGPEVCEEPCSRCAALATQGTGKECAA